MATRILQIRDLTLRDGQQSLFATRLDQHTIDELLPLYQNAGFYIVEAWGGAVPDSVMRYLGESPWHRLRSVSQALKGRSLISALSRGRNLFGYIPYPDTVLQGFYKEAIANGLNVMRIFDALNDIDNVRASIQMIAQLGGIPDAAVCYTVDPKPETPQRPSLLARLFGKKATTPAKIFTTQYFVDKAVQMHRLGAQIITLKDMAGLVTPLKAAEIINALKQAVPVPVDFHTHCTPGYGLASSLMAILNGVDILDTNIWWFGQGSAAPAIELIYIFCNKLGIQLQANMTAVGQIRDRLLHARQALKDFDLAKQLPRPFDPLNDTLPAEIDKLFDLAISAAKANDENTLLDACHKIEAHFNFPAPNQIVKNAEVPGGMYSNMVAQLNALNAADLLDDAMALIPKVRRDAGLVPLVTPTSQIVGQQAVLLAIDRRKGNPDYTQTSNQFISLVKGEYGHTPIPIDPAFRNQITGTPTETPYDVTKYTDPENPILPDLGGVKLASNTEEYLLLQLLPQVAKKYLRDTRAAAARAAASSTPTTAQTPDTAPEAVPITGPVLRAPMGGRIVEILVKPGDHVDKNTPLLIYEAMKMENEVLAEVTGTVKRVLVEPDQVVYNNQPLILFE